MCEVLVASDGKQALELIEQHVPDLVLLDVMRPRMDGFTVCQRVRRAGAIEQGSLVFRSQNL